MKRILRIVVNSIAFFLLILSGCLVFETNTLLALLMFIASIDQLEDVYTYTYNRRLFPKAFIVFDLVLEGILVVAGGMMLIYGFLYYQYFHTYFFIILLFLGLMIIESALEDLFSYMKYYSGGEEYEVRKEKRFVKEK